jgi:hypothetical protein
VSSCGTVRVGVHARALGSSQEVDCNSSCPKETQKRKELARSSADGRAVHGRRCLHGLCHGSQWPWLTSPMQAASPEVARARGPLNSLHPLVSSGGANNSPHCFLRVHSSSWPCPRYSEAIPARTSIMSVPVLPWLLQGKPRALCERAKRLLTVTARLEMPAHNGDLVAMCMMAVGPQCGGCVCRRRVCDIHAWIPCRLGYG